MYNHILKKIQIHKLVSVDFKKIKINNNNIQQLMIYKTSLMLLINNWIPQ
jgi:hypothetical protein